MLATFLAVIDLGPLLKSFADTAAAIAQLDPSSRSIRQWLTSPARLGKSVWLLLLLRPTALAPRSRGQSVVSDDAAFRQPAIATASVTRASRTSWRPPSLAPRLGTQLAVA